MEKHSLAVCTAMSIALALAAVTLRAEVVRVESQSRADVLNNKAFGRTGAYEKMSGKIYFAVDPRNSANRIIADIDKAPKNAAGKVEFSSDFYILKPKDLSRGNGIVLFEVSNRGGKGMIGNLNMGARATDPQTEAEFGDGFLMEHGFTLLWLGWQFDLPETPGLMRLYPPIAREPDGRRITGIVRSDFVAFEKSREASLADRDHIAYPVWDPSDPNNAMTVRDAREGPRRIVPRENWQFARLENGKVVPDPRRVYLASGFEPYKIYEVVYKAQDPPLAGVGLAAVRDIISRMKYGSIPELAIPQGGIDHALGIGGSQSARFLRTFLYYGFNEDESRRKVFDGLIPLIGGAGRGSFNHRFAQPSRDGAPYRTFFYPTDIFPFADVVQTDPQTSVRDGMATHGTKPEFMPKIFYVNSEYEYWGRAASLIHTTVDGLKDALIPSNVRIYVFASGTHVPAAFPPSRSTGQQLDNPLDYRWAIRSLLLAMNRWMIDGTAPPPSSYPRIDKGTLVPPDAIEFPDIPNVRAPRVPHKAYRADYGPEFLTKGTVTQEPPKLGPAFPVLVPQVDADGNELSGIRMPELAVPLATYTGWNYYNAESGPTDVLANIVGGFIPFPRTRKEREQKKDPRPSIEERYQNRDNYLALISRAAADLVARGFLIKDDAPRILDQARARWDFIMLEPEPVR